MAATALKPSNRSKVLSVLFALVIALSCTGCAGGGSNSGSTEHTNTTIGKSVAATKSSSSKTSKSSSSKKAQTTEKSSSTKAASTAKTIALSDVPAYNGKPYVVMNNNNPLFTKGQKSSTSAFENYSGLDSEGRCGVAFANICRELMPTKAREAIGMVKPSGWHTVKYQGVDGAYLYNRCHLIGFQLAGENANERNLITGTRYLNVDGMLPFENEVADYVKSTNHHVLYRVTPMFKGDDLVARGVLMEAQSVEDHGDGVRFCVFVYNVQPDVKINYATGESTGPAYTGAQAKQAKASTAQTTKVTQAKSGSGEKAQEYVLNTNTMKFHRTNCRSVSMMNSANKQKTKTTRSALIKAGYEACRICQP